jgi:hypothetical protein
MQRGVMSLRWVAAAALVMGVAMSQPAQAQDLPKMRIAVVATNVVNYSAEDATRVTLAISAALRRVLDVTVHGDLVTQTTAAQAAIDMQRCTLDAECIGDMRRALKVDALLLVSLARIGDVSRVDIRYVSPQSSEAVQVFQDTMKTLTIDDFEHKARDLVPDARVRDKPLPKEPVEPLKTRPDAVKKPVVVSKPAPKKQARGSRFTTPVLISGGVTVAALAGGITFGVLALGHSECEAEPGCAQSEADKADRQALISDVLLATAGVGAIVTAVLFTTAGDEQVRASVAPTRGGAAVVLGGRF